MKVRRQEQQLSGSVCPWKNCAPDSTGTRKTPSTLHKPQVHAKLRWACVHACMHDTTQGGEAHTSLK